MIEQENKENLILDSEVMVEQEAPTLYNPKFIIGYGTLFSVIAGGILMGMNFYRLGQKNRAWIIVGFSLLYTVFQITVLNLIEVRTTAITLPISYLGMYLVELLFWKKYVPADFKYNKRKVLAPILIALLVTIPLIVLTIISLQYQY